MNRAVDYSVVIPVYNEEQVIRQTYTRLKRVMDGVAGSYELIFVDDGSTDATRGILSGLAAQDSSLRLLIFSRNFGHQAAISAGLDYAAGRAVVVIDADLQDPPEVIPEMIARWQEGYQVVYGRRVRRKGETLFKRVTAAIFYRLLRRLSGQDLPPDVGDFRLLDRQVCDTLKGFREKNRYLRGIISWMGFRQGEVTYIREPREAGVTKYTLRKMLKLAGDAITSFSCKPLKASSYLGACLCCASLVFLAVVLYLRLLAGRTVGGWLYLGGVNLFFNGVLLLALGILGEYIGRIYEEARNRPLYIVAEQIGFPRGAAGRNRRDRGVLSLTGGTRGASGQVFTGEQVDQKESQRQ